MERYAQERVKTLYAAKDHDHGFPLGTETEANWTILWVRRPSNDWSEVLPPAGWGARRIIPGYGNAEIYGAVRSLFERT